MLVSIINLHIKNRTNFYLDVIQQFSVAKDMSKFQVGIRLKRISSGFNMDHLDITFTPQYHPSLLSRLWFFFFLIKKLMHSLVNGYVQRLVYFIAIYFVHRYILYTFR